MSSDAIYRGKAEELLRLATDNMAERSDLISQTVRWHMMAQKSENLDEAVDDLTFLPWDPDP